jgi:CRISPR-associated protein Csm2
MNQTRSQNRTPAPLFDPGKSPADLFDKLAEQQAEQINNINSNQLRRFFGEVKDLYRRFESLTAGKTDEQKQEIYRTQIEPLFKMVRSKVAYATRAGGQSRLPNDFANFVSEGVGKVCNAQQFRLFVMHFEAVVGFLYGSGKVRR